MAKLMDGEAVAKEILNEYARIDYTEFSALSPRFQIKSSVKGLRFYGNLVCDTNFIDFHISVEKRIMMIFVATLNYGFTKYSDNRVEFYSDIVDRIYDEKFGKKGS